MGITLVACCLCRKRTCQTLVPIAGSVFQLGVAAMLLGAWRGGVGWFAYLPDAFLAMRVRDALFWPGIYAVAMHTGVAVPVALEFGTLLATGTISTLAHVGHFHDMGGAAYHELHGGKYAPPAAGHFVGALGVTLLWWFMYWIYCTALHGGMASSEKAARLGTHPLSSAVRPTVESDISGALHLLGWGLWTIMVGAIGLVVVTGSASLPWVTVDMLSVLALLFALLNMAIVKLSSSLALHARDRLILNMLPQEAAEYPLRQIAMKDPDGGQEPFKTKRFAACAKHCSVAEEEDSVDSFPMGPSNGPSHRLTSETGEAVSPGVRVTRGSHAPEGRFARRVSPADPGRVKSALGPDNERTGEVVLPANEAVAAWQGLRGRAASAGGRSGRVMPSEMLSDTRSKVESSAASERPSSGFLYTASDVTLVAVELAGLQREACTDRLDASVFLANELHCAMERIAASMTGLTKVEPLTRNATLVVALNLRAPLRNHPAMAANVARQLFHAAMHLTGWSATRLTPGCKVAVATGAVGAAVLGRAQPTLTVMGEAVSDVTQLLDRTPVGWMSASAKTMRSSQGPSSAGFVSVEMYTKGAGIQTVYQTHLAASPANTGKSAAAPEAVERESR